MVSKQKGVATIVVAFLCAGAFGIGLFFKHFTKKIDSPTEQAAEAVLDKFGVDIDFSADKKKDVETVDYD